ncbi:Citron Rho-interacting kinase [Paragonimus heterotremus]|uniref:non-specific serine/threonine protein kinase n=1 Tax=Paragonimus heterotremus TaxID=100268 RepID=A0A8J4WFX5_9TREM|nr:Citron Rho-interacting kinase [Paragonimus heterotremus]
MASPIKKESTFLLPASHPSIASTPCRSIAEFDSPGSQGNLKIDETLVCATAPLHGAKLVNGRATSLRHSLGHISVHGMTPKRTVWTSQRTSRLFELLTRPALLFTPSLGIRLPFSCVDNKRSIPNLRLSMRKRNQPIDPDPCLLSVDGLLDCLFAMGNLVDQVYYDCKESEEDQGETDGYDRSSTILAADFFRKRVTPALTRLKDLRVKLSDFKLGKFIGRGACGVVRIVHEVAPPRSVYAMKSQYKGAWLHHDPEGRQLMLERTVLAQAAAIENPWLPHLHYAFQDEKHLHLVMDYEPGGDLYIFLSKVGHLLDSEMIAFYTAEAIEAIHSLHRMGYIHCDLKPENFAIERSGHLKLLDFGSAIRLDADGKCVCPTMVGTKEYLNIELLRQRGRHNEEPLLVGPEYDYWAIGVLLYELFYSHTPFYDEDEDAMMQKIMDYKRTLIFPTTVHIPDDAVQLIRSLITSPSKRLTYEGLVRHTFFRNVDFASLRQTTPPYLPPVGELDDVSNFSGGGVRTRDEAIMDVSTNQTFSPIRSKESGRGSLYRSALNDISCASSHNDTVLPGVQFVNTSPSSPHSVGKVTDENTEPGCESLVSSESVHPFSEREAKVKAIREAAALSLHEEIEEIEDIEWEGSDCVRNLPFVGYTFTPGLVLLRKLTSGQAAATLAAGLGTSVANLGATVVPGTPYRASLAANRQQTVLGFKSQTASHDLTAVDHQPTNTELLDKLSELQQLFDNLEKHMILLSPEHAEQAQNVQLCLANAIKDPSNMVAFGEAVQVLSNSLVSYERCTVNQLFGQLERLRDENKQLQLSNDQGMRLLAVIDKLRLALSRLDALPGDFTEADLLELSRTMCPDQGPDSKDSPVAQLIDLVLKHHRQAMAREAVSRAAVEAANRELKEAWEASKQQMGTLDSMIADQRQFRECENRLNREIQDLSLKLADAKEYQRDLRSRCVLYEDKYFAACDLVKEEKALADRLKMELENTKMHVKHRETDLEAAEHRVSTIREQLTECERLLNCSRQETATLRDRYDRLKEVTAEMEASLFSRENHSAMSPVRHQLVNANEEIKHLKDEIGQLRTQIDRLRLNNSQLVNQRDEANQEIRELHAALAQEKELCEVTQQASESEIFRLTTITKQQGKLIDHICGLLPPEHQPLRNLAGGRYELTHEPSHVLGKRSTAKSRGHHAFKTGAGLTGQSTGDVTESGGGSGAGGPLIAAASAFFARRRAPVPGKNDRLSQSGERGLSESRTMIKQPSRLQRIVRKSGLRFKRRTVVSARPNADPMAVESDQIFTEDEQDCAVGYHSPDSANDFEDGLPIHVPNIPATHVLDSNFDRLSTEDSISSGPSTTSSAPSGTIPDPNTKSSWRRRRFKARVGWADGFAETPFTSVPSSAKHRSHPKLLKQLSKVLGKGKQQSTHTEHTVDHLH